MAKRRAAAGLLLALGSAAGAALWRRRSGRILRRVDLYFADGSMVSLPEDSAEAARLLAIAQRVVAQAR